MLHRTKYSNVLAWNNVKEQWTTSIEVLSGQITFWYIVDCFVFSIWEYGRWLEFIFKVIVIVAIIFWAWKNMLDLLPAMTSFKTNKQTVAVHNRFWRLCLYNSIKTTHSSLIGRDSGLIKPDSVTPSCEIVQTAACILLPGVTLGIASFVLLCCVELNQNCLSWEREREGQRWWQLYVFCAKGGRRNMHLLSCRLRQNFWFHFCHVPDNVWVKWSLYFVYSTIEDCMSCNEDKAFFSLYMHPLYDWCFYHPGFSFLRTELSVAHRW